MTKSDSAVPYQLGTDDQQAWLRNYFFAPRGIGFLEPGVDALDANELAAYNVAKSSYQIRPDVFNLKWVGKHVGISPEEVAERIRRMYDERLIMFVMNPATQVSGWGLYYWFVKLREGTPEVAKTTLSDWFQEKDDICTGYRGTGDFDFFNGNHMRVLDNLLWDVIEPWKHNPEVEWVHLAPIRRDIRESNVNLWDVAGDGYAESIWADGQLEQLAERQDLMDLTDLKVFEALNTKRRMKDYYDFRVLADISGLDAKEMQAGIEGIVERKRTILPLFHLNFTKLGLTNHMFVIRLFQTTPDYRKAEITDELAAMPEFNLVLEFTDSFHDIAVAAWNDITDIAALRERLSGYAEIEEVLQADIDWMYRRWVCRLDDQNGFWEECVFTDDFLQNRLEQPQVRCTLTQPHSAAKEA